MVPPCELIARQLGLLFTCSTVNQYTRIQTPFLYPDGDIIDIFYQEGSDAVTLTDLGETLRWLKMQTTTQRKSSRQQQLIADICLNHNVEFSQGVLMMQVRQPEELASALMRLSQSILRVSDLWFTFRNKVGESIVDEVDDLLQECSIEFVRKPRVPGQSLRIWQPDFQIGRERQSTLVRVLSTGSRAAVPDLVNSTVAMWYDLGDLRAHGEVSKFISLFDDTLDVWKLEDLRLVEKLSDIAYWSRSDEFLEKIA